MSSNQRRASYGAGQVANGGSYLGLASRAKELNVGENSQAERDVSARTGFTMSEMVRWSLRYTKLLRRCDGKT